MTIEIGNAVVPIKNDSYMNWPVKDGCDVVGIVTEIIHNKPNPLDPELPDFTYVIFTTEKVFSVWEGDIKVLI